MYRGAQGAGGPLLYFRDRFYSFVNIFLMRHRRELSSTQKKMLPDLIFHWELSENLLLTVWIYADLNPFWVGQSNKSGEKWQGSRIALGQIACVADPPPANSVGQNQISYIPPLQMAVTLKQINNFFNCFRIGMLVNIQIFFSLSSSP